jgi:hypothetical protein
MSQQRPRSVMVAIWLLVALVALTGISALLSVVLEEELIDTWTVGQSSSGSVEPPSFVPVAIVLFIVLALLAGVLLMFFREGLNWARIALTCLVVFMGIATLAGLRTHPPVLFWVLSLAALGLDVALLGCLWHRQTRAFCAGPSVQADHRS